MVGLILFGVLLLGLSIWMAWRPEQFANKIHVFSQSPVFHIFEILSRLMLGALLVICSNQSARPNIIYSIGLLLVLVAMGLALIGPKLHIRFAEWTSIYLQKRFRLLGILSILVALVYFYAVIGTTA